jgi:hypothetical protein
MCHGIHTYAQSDILIIMMRRDLADIKASEKRIDWKTGPYREYEHYGIKRQVAKYYRGRNLKPIAELKYKLWNTFQKHIIEHYEEIDYQSLACHPLWLSKSKRKHFAVNQTE